jgi:calcineurin-like phosphoesterase
VKTETVMPRYLTGMPSKFEVCELDPRFNAVVADIDEESGRALNIVRINERIDMT